MSTITPRRRSTEHVDRTVNRLLEGELLDLYAAILIVVPIAVLMRSLWP
jgi:TRAP-type C4-dicarboxylate transport system permease small subunit